MVRDFWARDIGNRTKMELRTTVLAKKGGVMIKNFIENGLDVDEIRRETGISPHVIKSEAIILLDKMGVKHYEYELLRLVCTCSTGWRGVTDVEPAKKCALCTKMTQDAAAKLKMADLKGIQKEIVAKIVQGAGFEDLCEVLTMSPATLKSQLKQILTTLCVRNIEYTLLSELLKPKSA